jgi:hypothetical protein
MNSLKLKKFSAVALLAIGAAFAFTACGSSDGGGGTVAAVPAPVGTGPTGPGVVANTCQIGQVFVTTYGCLAQQSCQAGYGWLPGENRCLTGTLVTEDVKFGTAYGVKFFGSLQVTNANQFKLLLQNAGYCDNPFFFYWGTGQEQYDCNYWVNRGGFIDLRSFGTATTALWNMTIGAGTSNPNTWQPYYTNTGYKSVSQQARAVDYNNSAGMQLVGVSSGGGEVGLRIRTDNGRPESNSFVLEVVYQNVVFAKATVSKY